MRQPESTSLIVPDAGAMRALGLRLGEALLKSSNAAAFCVALEGELGAGKTTFVGGVMAAAGIDGPVRSPTYTLIEPYEAVGRHFYHLDLYRLTDPAEIEPLGVRDLLLPGSILLIEWPCKAPLRLPPFDVWIRLAYEDPPGSGREVAVEGRTAAGIGLLPHFLR
jgi:tRNA threonylcarbamoyladenosine biosynthesis protein TsaE